MNRVSSVFVLLLEATALSCSDDTAVGRAKEDAGTTGGSKFDSGSTSAAVPATGPSQPSPNTDGGPIGDGSDGSDTRPSSTPEIIDASSLTQIEDASHPTSNTLGGDASGLDASSPSATSADASRQPDASNQPDARPPITADDLEQAALELMARIHLPAVALSTFDVHGVTWSSAFGYADPETQRAATADTSFWLASVTKPITGLSLLRAREQGLLTLDTHVADLLAASDDFSLGAPFASEIKLSDLVTHQSSIRDSAFYACSYYSTENLGDAGSHILLADSFAPDVGCSVDVPVDLGGFLGAYLTSDGAYYSSDNFQATPPGSVFEYSNVGAALAGYALQLATGTSLADFSKGEFFQPLGLSNTSFYSAELTRENIATPTYWDPDAQSLNAYPFYELATYPDGGLRSSANDLGKLLAALLGGGQLGGTRILRPESVELAFTPQRSFGDANQIGVFWEIVQIEAAPGAPARRLIQHNGSDPGALSYVVFDPDNQFGLVLLGNGEWPGDDDEAGLLLNTLVSEQFEFSEQQAALNRTAPL